MAHLLNITVKYIVIGIITVVVLFGSISNAYSNCMKFHHTSRFQIQSLEDYSFTEPSQERLSRKEYIEKYKHIAIRQMNQYGIPASIIMAQACLESGNGNSRLAVKANNHFGIKCHNWNGKRIYHDDDQRGECFRKYNEVEDSFKDHSEFLKNGRRYQSLFDLKKTDYKAWAHGLKAAGYATNPQYAHMLIEIIEKNELYKLDGEFVSLKENKKLEREQTKTNKANRKAEKALRKEQKRSAKAVSATTSSVAGTVTAGATATQTINAATGTVNATNAVDASPLYRYSLDRPIYKNNGVQYIVATGTETYGSIAKEYNLFTKELLKFNDLHSGSPVGKSINENSVIVSGTIVYLEAKKKSGEKSAYVVQSGESMYVISQKLGIKLLQLYKLNNMTLGSEVEPGKILNLQ